MEMISTSETELRFIRFRCCVFAIISHIFYKWTQILVFSKTKTTFEQMQTFLRRFRTVFSNSRTFSHKFQAHQILWTWRRLQRFVLALSLCSADTAQQELLGWNKKLHSGLTVELSRNILHKGPMNINSLQVSCHPPSHPTHKHSRPHPKQMTQGHHSRSKPPKTKTKTQFHSPNGHHTPFPC